MQKKDLFKDIEKMEVPEDKKVRIYYGNGEDSLETAPAALLTDRSSIW